jgi:hypothetical protein
MTRHLTSRLLLCGIMATLPFGTYAQSLADVAAAEAARRKTTTTTSTPVKTYTNDDLGGAPSTGAAPTPAKPADAAAKDTEKKPDQKAPDDTKTEKYWRDRASSLQQSRGRNKILLDALQSQVNGLNAEYLSKDDPGQRALLEKKIQTASGELQRVQQEMEKQKQAETDLQDEARKAGVPAGWVR